MLDRNNLDYEIRELTITVPFLEFCPLCGKKSTFLKENLEHILDHLTVDKLDQSLLMRWLSSINHEKNSRLSTQNDSFQNFAIDLPEISSNWKCLFCDCFIYPEGNMINHVFEHLKVPRQKMEHLKLWFNNFLKNEESDFIVKTFNNFVIETKNLNTTSVLLEKLPLFENQKTNTCRYCKITLANATTLHSHYVEWHSDLQVKAWNCPICNFKEIDSDKFVAHVYKKHLCCVFCRNRFSCFEACCKHTKLCLRGCPFCYQNFSPFKQLLLHLNENEDLKCPYCNECRSESEQLKGHMRECSSRPQVSGVFCPLCKHLQFTEENEFIAHLQICKPWVSLSVPRNMICSGIRQNQVSDDNFINFSDIEEHVNEKITGIIRNRFN